MRSVEFLIYQPFSICEIGGRANNEDSIFPKNKHASDKDRLFLVCDGVGGAEKGEVASAILCESIPEYLNSVSSEFTKEIICQSIEYAANKIQAYKDANADSKKMASTLSLLSLIQGKIFVAWAGDSRVYQIRNGKIIFQTEDHSLVNILVKQGEITEEEARHHPKKNQILRSVSGSDDPSKADIVEINDVQIGDYFFMCTDGTLEQVTNQVIGNICNGKLMPAEIIKHVYELCAGKTKDNFSCYLLRLKEVPNDYLKQNNKSLNKNPLIKATFGVPMLFKDLKFYIYLLILTFSIIILCYLYQRFY